MTMFERTLREWMGIRGTLQKLGPFRMTRFNCVGDVMICRGKIKDKYQDRGLNIVKLDIWIETGQGQTAIGEATVVPPARQGGFN